MNGDLSKQGLNNLLKSAMIIICAGLIVAVSVYFMGDQLKHRDLIFNLGCTFIFTGVLTIFRYLYWNTSKNKSVYAERLREESINLRDERKMMLREKSGQIVYQIMFLVLFAANIVFTILGVDMWIILTIYGIIAFQYVSGLLVYRYLARRL